MVRKFGRPDLFVTFTCNPTWVDIINVLERQQRPEDRPDIVVCVLTELLDVYLEYASAELPDLIADPTLFQIITRCVIHGPCGTLNPNSPCMREGVSTKEYLKEFREKKQKRI
ncbi:hypothetical protein AVEN_198375-1 [Araneus ventricosus]|uniref:Helitron helicase-like domain-containing protein n=1 Tax=Araneus ventricosus TaxID=182803 RepID=A0A4Y2FK60_ARAVE|nr:hypothetical protein AVEN_198375-1 [Araneus ventricosus]